MPMNPDQNSTPNPDVGSSDIAKWKWLGIIRHEKRDFPGAIIALEKALELDPHDEYIWRCIGDCRREIGEFKEAFTVYRKALEINPRLTQTIDFLGIVCRETGDLQGGIEVFKKVLGVDPKHTEALLKLAEFSWDVGDFEEFISAFVKLLDISVIGWYNLGMGVFMEKEQHAKALFCFQRTVDLGLKMARFAMKTCIERGATPKDPFSLEEQENNPEEIRVCFDKVMIWGLHED